MGLDRTDSPTELALQQRRTAADRGEGGIEVASIQNYDTSSLSYFGSKTSIGGSDFQGYYSSSLPPDDLYESSDYRVSYIQHMLFIEEIEGLKCPYYYY